MHPAYRLGITAALVASPLACNREPETTASSSLAIGTPVSDAQLQAVVDNAGNIYLRTEDPTQKAITRVDDLQATAESGTIVFSHAAVQLNGVSDCTGMPQLTCTTPEPKVTRVLETVTVTATATVTETKVTPEDPLKKPTDPQPSRFKVITINRPGMACGPHYDNGNKWQKRFDVGLEADAEALAAVDYVEHGVFGDYASGKAFKVTTPENNFTTNIGFMTPVTSWALTGTTAIHLKSGNSFSVGGGQVRWTDDDPQRKAGTACTP